MGSGVVPYVTSLRRPVGSLDTKPVQPVPEREAFVLGRESGRFGSGGVYGEDVDAVRIGVNKCEKGRTADY